MILYRLIFYAARIVLGIWHPVFRVSGRENIPKGSVIFCCNHSGNADPAWVLFALRPKRDLQIMAKIELMKIPVIGAALRYMGAFGVDRGGNDVHAIKTALQCLKSGDRLLIFPEGTRVKEGEEVEPKTGVALLAVRTGTPVVPMWLTRHRRPWSPLRMVIGKPYIMQAASARPTPEELRALTSELMDKIYELEPKA